MCRLALINAAGAEELQARYGLRKYFDFLEKRLGGSGNGYALIENGKVKILEKGVMLRNREIAEKISKSKYDWLIYHTRLASCGTVSDRNCHPFRRGDDVLAANGTEIEMARTAREYGLNVTDTELVLRYGLTENDFYDDLRIWSSVLVGLHKGKVYAVRNHGRLERMETENENAVIIGSEFPPLLPSRSINQYFGN